ncbi:hypothetical protein MMC10_009604 [Thelotrema lepadinum]|nr:hypothetical protein [Thelotrema lepadinum]
MDMEFFISRLRDGKVLGYIGKIWWDDWAMLISFLLALAITIIWTYYCSIKGLYHAYELTDDELSQALLMNWIGQTFCVAAAAASKTAIALLIARIQSKNYWRTLCLWIISAASLIVGVIIIFIVWFQCTPLQGLWRLDLRATCLPSSVLITNTIWVSSVWAASDLALAIIPAHMIWHLQMPLKKKLVLSSMLGCGIFAFICAVVKISYLKDDGNSPDLTWNSLDLYVWHTNEVNVVIIAGCIPTLRPLFVVLFRRPGYEEFVRKGQRYAITEETQVTVELSSRDAMVSQGSKKKGNLSTTYTGMTKGDGSDYGHQAWAGDRREDAL